MADIDTSKHEFQVLFHCGKDVTFHVNYYRSFANKTPHFTTTADIFNRNHSGLLRGPSGGSGQCQARALKMNDSFLPGNEHAKFMAFWTKWNTHHLHKLSAKQLNELVADIDELKQTGAPYMESRDGDHELFLQRHSANFVKTKPHTAYNIKWVTNGKTLSECGLPRGSVILPFGLTSEEKISAWLASKFKYDFDGFRTNFKTDEEQEG